MKKIAGVVRGLAGFSACCGGSTQAWPAECYPPTFPGDAGLPNKNGPNSLQLTGALFHAPVDFNTLIGYIHLDTGARRDDAGLYLTSALNAPLPQGTSFVQ